MISSFLALLMYRVATIAAGQNLSKTGVTDENARAHSTADGPAGLDLINYLCRDLCRNPAILTGLRL
jgi:hypothetical protein